MNRQQIKELLPIIQAYADGGVSCENAGYDPACVFASFGSRLALKTIELAEYAGKQFLSLYADYFL